MLEIEQRLLYCMLEALGNQSTARNWIMILAAKDFVGH